MPWEKTFDIDEVLERAMDVFWENGYEASSTQTLLDKMHINRGSLYATYGNKQSLFLKSLRHYIFKYQDQFLAHLRADCEARSSITTLFQQIAQSALDDKMRRGCFLVNTALDVAPSDSEVQKFVAGAFDRIEGFFKTQIATGQNTGTIPASVNGQQVGSLLLTLMIGLRVISRNQPDKARTEAILAQVNLLLG